MQTHVSDQLIDAYAGGQLSLMQRIVVTDHTFECEACERKVTLASLSRRVEQHIWTLLTEPDDEADTIGDVHQSCRGYSNSDCAPESRTT